MKKLFYLIAFILPFFIACSSDESTTVDQPLTSEPVPTPVTEEPAPVDVANKVLVLKVDLLTNAFEGGKELEFDDAETFSISADLNPADDFGDITLNYEETASPLFAGGIVWMGTGEITYPVFELPDTFETQAAAPVPAASDFEYAYGFTGDYLYEDYYTTINYAALWQSIGTLQLVHDYRALNPGAKIKLYLYTPGIGIGDPAQWKWIIFIKN